MPVSEYGACPVRVQRGSVSSSEVMCMLPQEKFLLTKNLTEQKRNCSLQALHLQTNLFLRQDEGCFKHHVQKSWDSSRPRQVALV